MNHFRIFILLITLMGAGIAQAQRFPGSGGSGGFGSRSGGGSSKPGLLVRDTSEIYYFHSGNPNEIHPFSDSLLGNLQQYDPIRKQPFDYANLGNPGSAHRPLFYQPTFRRGFDAGLHQFDLYRLTTADVRYYKLTQAYTQAAYTQGATQADAQTDVVFSRNFADGLNLSLEHHRINNAGAYDNQKALNAATAFGLWYHNKYGNYDGFFSFTTNSMEQQDNGGIAPSADSLLTDPFRLDVNLANSNTRHAHREYAYSQYFYLNKILSSEAKKRRTGRKQKREKERAKRKAERLRLKRLAKDSTLRDSSLLDSLPHPDSLKSNTPNDSLSQNPDLRSDKKKVEGGPKIQGDKRPASGKNPQRRPARAPSSPPPSSPPVSPPSVQRDSRGANTDTVPEGRLFTLYHQFLWQTDSYKFSALPADSLFFGGFWIDNRGLRHFLETKKLQNTVKLQTFKLRQTKPDSTGRRRAAQSDLLEVGLVHAFHIIGQEPLKTERLNDLFLTGSFHFSPNDRIRIRTYGHLGIGANTGDFRLSGDLFFNLKKIGNLRLEAANQLSTPPLLPRQFYVTEQQIWKNDFNKTLETSLMGTYSLASLHLAIGGQYHLVDNLIYFDSTGIAQQNGGVLSVFQLTLRKDFHLGLLHSENWIGFQQSTSDVLRLPKLYSKHSLYLEGKIFKKNMLTRIGADARLTTGYAPYGYQPLTGQFYLQAGQSLPFTPLVDVFLNLKVKTFRFFFKVENLLPFASGKYYFQTAGYPLPFGYGNGGLRFGINWRLVD
ncbi:MAG TPA: hypothetical protein ENJ95_07035 [Bacteroidetes bacterium]|nr:hypothetical protein [Bacteroidota bacterium]